MSLSFTTGSYRSELPVVLLAGAYEERYFVDKSSKEDTDLRVNLSSTKRLRSRGASFKVKRHKAASSSNFTLEALGKRTFLEGLNPRLIKGSILGEMLEDEPDDSEIFKSICGRVHFVACQQLIVAMRLGVEEKLKPELTEKLRSIVRRVAELDVEGVSQLTQEGIAEIEARKELAFEDIKHYVSSILTRDLQTVIQILDRLIEVLKDENKVPQLISFCLNEYDILFPGSDTSDRKDLLRFQILFEIFDYLKLDDFQKEYFEPFNEKFPSYPFSKTPRNIKQLKFSNISIQNVDLSRLSSLEEITLESCVVRREFGLGRENRIQKFFDSIPNKKNLTTVRFVDLDTNELDLSRFVNIKSLYLDDVHNSKFFLDNIIKDNIESLYFKGCECFGFIKNLDFSKLVNLRELFFEFTIISSYDTGLGVDKFNANVNASNLEKLHFISSNMQGFDYSKYTEIREIKLERVINLTAVIFNGIPNKEKVRKLELVFCDVLDFDFSGFNALSLLRLSNITDLDETQFNSIPNKQGIEVLNLNGANTKGFDFSRFIRLKELILCDVEYFTAAQFNAIPNKSSIELLDLTSMNVAGFDFSGFTSLKKLDLEDVEGLTKDQFESIPNRNFIKKQISIGL
jgi:hypothetical protein